MRTGDQTRHPCLTAGASAGGGARIQILSDLHLEFDRDGGKAFVRTVPSLGDVLILGGDLIPLREADPVRRAFGWFCDRFAHVIFVPGNHEYYRTRPTAAEALLTACARKFPNLHVLNPGTVSIDGIRFVGATLWFPDTPDEALYRGSLGDFRLIGDFVPWVHDTHAAHLAFLKTNVRPGDVVVTHHLPHPQSIAPQYAGSELNRFFVVVLDALQGLSMAEAIMPLDPGVTAQRAMRVADRVAAELSTAASAPALIGAAPNPLADRRDARVALEQAIERYAGARAAADLAYEHGRPLAPHEERERVTREAVNRAIDHLIASVEQLR